MPELTEPELTRKERWTRDYILALLPNGYGDPAEMNDEEILLVRSVLAKQYVEHTNLGVLWKTGVMLFVYDWMFLLDSQVYGLVLGTLGSVALALPSLYTPETLAENTVGRARGIQPEIEAKAEVSVKTNVGVTGLAVGFVWQILSLSGPIPKELLPQNPLQGVFPNWLGALGILVLGFLVLGRGLAAIQE